MVVALPIEIMLGKILKSIYMNLISSHYFRHTFNLFGKQSNLHLCGAGIFVVRPMRLDYFLFYLSFEHYTNTIIKMLK